MHMGQSVRLQGDKCRIHQNLMHCSAFNLPQWTDCSSHRERIQSFFYTKESQSFVKPSSFKSRALKFSPKSIINAVLSTSLLFFFFTLCHIRGLHYRCLYTPICKHILESLDSIKRRACAQNVCFSILLRFSNWLKAMWNTYLSGKFCLCFIFQNAYMSALLEAL